ncbi:MAG: MtaA/CmuA family methyltransferase [Rhodospirillaceae bacterium]|jgi:MtaA/CmuA family methyltransferase|nr:MtaA/CmuA family methyltransferase [Rhodospirillaceae bacterium]MBT5243636.1 MtaA/CmuA family methyltransferase [Rhodospirillaceae bacterium]MBT5561984.1 MtaA/CmuA family methyltransferase [Rhodospirillaceae bacterium]MBT6240393.1 MtaA/CmuA family methyltransferase [Rhodospirillaceae bacterium]
MTPRQRFLAALNRQPVDRPAIANPTSIITTDLQEKLGIYFPEAHHDAEKMAALAMAGHTILGYDVVFPVFAGGTHEAESLGVPVRWGDQGHMPACEQAIWKTADDIVIPDDFLEHPAITTPIEAIRILKREVGDEVGIIGKVYGPWSMAYHCFGLSHFLKMTIKDPDMVSAILHGLKEVAIRFGRAQVEAGADALCYGAHITGDLIRPDAYPKFLESIDSEMEAAIGAPLIFHCCGKTMDRIEYFNANGQTAFHFESQNDPAEMKAKANMVLVGNINNPDIIFGGTPEDVRREVHNVLDAGVDIIAPECAVPLNAPMANVKAVADAVKEYSATS